MATNQDRSDKRVVTSVLPESQQDNVIEAEMTQPKRASWGRKVEFMLTCIGYAVGLGNIWRFPYLCFKNGGGAFLLPYVLTLALVGMPMFYFELSLGQFSSSGPIKVWSIVPLMKGVGYCMVLSGAVVSLYYNVILTWAVYFLIHSFTATLPWIDCDNKTWTTPICITGADLNILRQNETLLNQTMEELGLNSTSEFETPSEQFFYRKVLQMSSGIEEMGSPIWQLVLINLFCWTVVFLVLIKGIGSLGKAVYVSTLFPYIMMIILVVRGCTLDGAWKGLSFYLIPDMERLLEAKVWGEAATQIFFSLCVSQGGLITMASYNKFHNAVDTDSLIIPVINCCTSFFSGFAIFSVLGFMAAEKDVDVADVAAAGPGLVFVVYPEALAQMPLPTLWAILFFLMLITLGFSSQFSNVETVLVALTDEIDYVRRTPRRTLIFRLLVCFTYFLFSLPLLTQGGFYLFQLVENYSATFPLLIGAFFEVTTVMWIYGFRRFSEDIYLMIGKKPNLYFRVCWTIVVPAILSLVFMMICVQYVPLALDDYEYPGWAEVLGWMLTTSIIGWIPITAFYTHCKDGGFKVIQELLQPDQKWGPALAQHRHATSYGQSPLDLIQKIHSRNRSVTIEGLRPSGLYNLGLKSEHNSLHTAASLLNDKGCYKIASGDNTLPSDAVGDGYMEADLSCRL